MSIFTGTDEMRALQTRLEETEKQMARILKAMQTVSSKVSNVVESEEVCEDKPKLCSIISELTWSWSHDQIL